MKIRKTIIDGYNIEVEIEKFEGGHYLIWKDGFEIHTESITEKLFECLWEEF